MKILRSVCPFVVSLSIAYASLSIAQTPAATPKEKENAGVRHQTHGAGPLVVKWPLKNLKGEANLIVDPDGHYLFSGTVNDKKKDRDFDIAIALKSSIGAIYVFRFSGGASNGVQWSKEGKSTILKDNFKSFAGAVDWSGEWRLPLSAAGDAKLYAEREKKLAALKKEEEEAKKRHDAKVAAERRAEIEKREQEEREEAQAASKSDGTSIGSTISGIASTVGSVVSTISSVGQAIAGLF